MRKTEMVTKLDLAISELQRHGCGFWLSLFTCVACTSMLEVMRVCSNIDQIKKKMSIL